MALLLLLLPIDIALIFFGKQRAAIFLLLLTLALLLAMFIYQSNHPIEIML